MELLICLKEPLRTLTPCWLIDLLLSQLNGIKAQQADTENMKQHWISLNLFNLRSDNAIARQAMYISFDVFGFNSIYQKMFLSVWRAQQSRGKPVMISYSCWKSSLLQFRGQDLTKDTGIPTSEPEREKQWLKID